MGQYFLIANHNERQFIDPFRFPCSEKFPSILSSVPLQATITMLVCSSVNPKWRDLRQTSCTATQQLLGSWAGQIEILGDYSEEELSRNVRKDYEDISSQCITMLFDLGVGGTARVLENIEEAAPFWIEYLVAIASSEEIPESVDHAFRSQFGSKWNDGFYELVNRSR